MLSSLSLFAAESSRKRVWGAKEVHGTVVLRVSAKATKTQIKEAVQHIFKVKVAGVRTANFYADAPPGSDRRISLRLEEGIRQAGRWRKDDRVCGEFVRPD